MVEPIAGRACGECYVCCRNLTIAELHKLPGVVCPHYVTGTGCGIYETRPEPCREWYCGWRLVALGDEWRPDRCEILISVMGGPAPDGLMDGFKFEFFGAPDRVRWEPFVTFAAKLIEGRVPVYISAPGGAGFASGRVYLNRNETIRTAVARRDFPRMTNALSQALQICIERPKKLVNLES